MPKEMIVEGQVEVLEDSLVATIRESVSADQSVQKAEGKRTAKYEAVCEALNDKFGQTLTKTLVTNIYKAVHGVTTLKGHKADTVRKGINRMLEKQGHPNFQKDPATEKTLEERIRGQFKESSVDEILTTLENLTMEYNRILESMTAEQTEEVQEGETVAA